MTQPRCLMSLTCFSHSTQGSISWANASQTTQDMTEQGRRKQQILVSTEILSPQKHSRNFLVLVDVDAVCQLIFICQETPSNFSDALNSSPNWASSQQAEERKVYQPQPSAKFCSLLCELFCIKVLS